jgi:hypothetical protein
VLFANNSDFLEQKNQLLVQRLGNLKENFPTKKLSVLDKNPILTNAIILNHLSVILLMIRQQELFALLENQKHQMCQVQKKHQQPQKCQGQQNHLQHLKENQQKKHQHSKLS